MAPRISLALALHHHQPVGNFGWVLAEVYDQAYQPIIAALERHPRVRMSLHYTGPLLDWFVAERPDAIARLRALSERGQVEILGGGYYEPVLASLPERDRIGQLARMADVIEARFGRRPGGAWLAERVWEPDLPTSLVSAGYRWTILDDAHFRAAAIPEEDSGVHTRRRTRATSCASSGPSRDCAIASRFARWTRSSTTCARTRPKPATGSG